MMKLKIIVLLLLLSCVSPKLFAQKAASPDSVGHSLSEKILGLPKQILGFADDYLRRPYRRGGITPRGFDCSGFVHYCFKNFGLMLPHSSAAQGLLGTSVSKEAALPGDLIFFKGHNAASTRIGHVGIITEVNDKTIRFIHSAHNGGVRYDTIDAAYYKKRFVGIKRVIGWLNFFEKR